MANGVNQMAAQGVASRMQAPPQGGPPGMGGPPMQGGQPGMAGPPGMGGQGGDPRAIQQGKQMLQQLTMLLSSDPRVMLALAPDLQAFGNVIKELVSTAGQPGGGAPMGPQGPPPMGGGGAPPMAGPAR